MIKGIDGKELRQLLSAERIKEICLSWREDAAGVVDIGCTEEEFKSLCQMAHDYIEPSSNGT